MSSYKVLLVDDEPFFFELITELLTDNYHFEYAADGETCLEKADSLQPDIILLDVQMPGMDGYETCRRLKFSESCQNIPVFFVSANDSIEEKLKGYDAGGDDYIVKPLDGSEIDRKIKLFLDRHRQQADQKRALQQATSTARTALSSQGELGVVISYLTNSFLCQDLDSITNQLIISLKDFGYYAVVRLSSNLSTVTRNSKFEWNPIEDAMIDEMKCDARIEEVTDWIFFNNDRVSIMLRKSDAEPDEEKRGRVKDHVSFLMQGTEARIHNLNVEQDLDAQTSSLFNLVKAAHRKIDNYSAQKTFARRSISESIDQFYREFENNLAGVSLTENQEKDVLTAVDDLVELMIEIVSEKYNDHMVLNSLLQEIKKMLADP